MARKPKSDETLKVNIVSGWLTVNVDGVGRTVVLVAIGSFTFLCALYMYLVL